MNDSLLTTLINLDNAFGVSGDEEDVACVLKKEMAGLYDDFFTDPLGNQFFVKYGKNREKKVLLAAHMDEIGYIVSAIDDNGFIKFVPVGYHDDRTAVNQDMVIKTDSGRKVFGVTGSKPAHIMSAAEHEKVLMIEELFLDVGTDSKEESLALGINIGDYIGFARNGYLLNGGNYYTGKSVDDRAGCAVLVEVMRRLQGVELEETVVMAGTTQEEVGMRAGGPIANRIQPEFMLALDVTITGDTPGIARSQCSCDMGKGTAIKYYDWDGPHGGTGSNTPRKVTRHLIEVANRYRIPFQREVITGGGTDAWSASMAGSGFLCGGISIPQRYMHTAVGTINLQDLEYTVQLVFHVLTDYQTL